MKDHSNYSVVDMELTPTAPSSIHTGKPPAPLSQGLAPACQSPPHSSQTTSGSSTKHTVVMAAGPSMIHTRKRKLESEEENDQLPEEFHPLAVSTPNVSCYLLQQHGRSLLREVFTVQAGRCSGGRWNGRRNVMLAFPKSFNLYSLSFQEPQNDHPRGAGWQQ